MKDQFYIQVVTELFLLFTILLFLLQWNKQKQITQKIINTNYIFRIILQTYMQLYRFYNQSIEYKGYCYISKALLLKSHKLLPFLC